MGERGKGEGWKHQNIHAPKKVVLPLRLELLITFAAVSKVVTCVNYILTKFPSDWRGLNQTCMRWG